MRIFFMQGDRFYYIQPVIRVSKKKNRGAKGDLISN